MKSIAPRLLFVSGCVTVLSACDPAVSGVDSGASDAGRTDASGPRADAPVECDDPSVVLGAAGAWDATALSEVASGTTHLHVLARATTLPTDAVVGLALGVADDFGDLPVAIRFADTGVIEARDGDAYRADARVEYVAGQWYEVDLDIRFTDSEYDVSIARCGEAPIALVTGAAFRTGATSGSVDQLVGWTDGRGEVEVADPILETTACEPRGCGDLCGARPDGCGGTLTCTPCLPSDRTYGPDGTHWPSRTPACETTPVAVASSWDQVVAALRTASGGDVIHLRSGDYGAPVLNDAAVLARAATWTTMNVLVCAAPGETPRFGNLQIEVPYTSWSGLTIGANFAIKAGADFTRLARTRFGGAGYIFVHSAHSAELVEVVIAERGMNGDRMQITPTRPGDPPPRDLLIEGSWLEGTTVTLEGEHSDVIQTLGMTGTFTLRDTYIGPAGNNATIQAGQEFQGGVPYADYVAENVYFGGAEMLGNGNVFGLGRTTRYADCEFDVILRVRPENLPVEAMTGCRAENDPTYPDGTRVAVRFPDNEFGVEVVRPTFVPPPWW